MMKMRPTNRSGQVFIFFLILTSVCLMLIVALLSLQSQTYRTARSLSTAKDLVYLAEAGMDKGFAAFKASSSYTGETFTLGNGSITTAVTSGSTANEKFLTSIATIGTRTKRLKTKLITSPNATAVSFNYALQSGADGFDIGGNSTINGSVYSNGNIVGNNGSAINGNASAVGSISSKIVVSGTKTTSVAPQPLPAFDANFWKQKAQAGGTITGDYTPPDNSIIGPKYIDGNLIIAQQSTITVQGPIYATGMITFGNGPTISVDNSLGTNGVMLVSEGAVQFGNSITINSTSQGGDLLIASLGTAVDTIKIINNALTINGPLYAPNGGILIGNNAHAVAFSAKKITTGNNAIIDYDSGLASESFTYGPGGTWTIQKGSYEEY
jgi:hypothetical protein